MPTHKDFLPGDFVQFNKFVTQCGLYMSNLIHVEDEIATVCEKNCLSIVLYSNKDDVFMLVLNSKLNVVGWTSACNYEKIL